MSIFLDEKEIPVFPYQFILVNDKFRNELQGLQRRWRILTDPKKKRTQPRWGTIPSLARNTGIWIVGWTYKIHREEIHYTKWQNKTPNIKERREDYITTREVNNLIKTLQRGRSLRPYDIPNEIFIEADPTTRELLRYAINHVHQKETIPTSWLQGNITRLYQGKGVKGERSNERGIILADNVGSMYERMISARSQKGCRYHKAQSGQIPWSATADHLIAPQTNYLEIKSSKKCKYKPCGKRWEWPSSLYWPTKLEVGC